MPTSIIVVLVLAALALLAVGGLLQGFGNLVVTGSPWGERKRVAPSRRSDSGDTE